MAEAYIVAATRTAGGRKGGRLRDWHPADLGGAIIDELVKRVGVDPARIDDVVMGCVTQAGEQSGNIARGAVLSSRLPVSVPATTVDRQCGSSQQALHFAAQAVMSGSMDIVIAAGVESMTRVPMGLSTRLPAEAGFGGRKGRELHARFPGVEFSQFASAEMIAETYGLSRETLDEFGCRSQQLASAATKSGFFADEILPVQGVDEDGNSVVHDSDEGIRHNATPEAMAGVKLLRDGGRITAATSSQICDGASGVMIVSERVVKEAGLQPLARIHHMTVLGHDPVTMLDAPIPATRRALERSGMTIGDIDLYEVNEAFASIPLAWRQALDADPDRLNVHGGAIALGHPLGASGTKLMTTLLGALKRRGKTWGLQTMCEGGGLANVTIVERL